MLISQGTPLLVEPPNPGTALDGLVVAANEMRAPVTSGLGARLRRLALQVHITHRHLGKGDQAVVGPTPPPKKGGGLPPPPPKTDPLDDFFIFHGAKRRGENNPKVPGLPFIWIL